jgi:hypothetical protein
MSVSLHKLHNKDGALKFLNKAGSELANFLLDEKEEVWQTRWDTQGIPLYFVFDRAGRRAGKFCQANKKSKEDESYPDFSHEEIEKLVTELLKAKP